MENESAVDDAAPLTPKSPTSSKEDECSSWKGESEEVEANVAADDEGGSFSSWNVRWWCSDGEDAYAYLSGASADREDDIASPYSLALRWDECEVEVDEGCVAGHKLLAASFTSGPMFDMPSLKMASIADLHGEVEGAVTYLRSAVISSESEMASAPTFACVCFTCCAQRLTMLEVSNKNGICPKLTVTERGEEASTPTTGTSGMPELTFLNAAPMFVPFLVKKMVPEMRFQPQPMTSEAPYLRP